MLRISSVILLLALLSMERLIKKRDGIKYQVECIYDYVKSVTSEDGESVKTTAKVLAKKQDALSVYKERYDQIFEELLNEASTTEEVEEIHYSYKVFQGKCTGIEEIIDIIEDNYFPVESTRATSASASSSTFDATILQAVKEIVNNQVESLQRITAQQQESLKDLFSANKVSASEAKLPQLDLKSFSGGYTQWSEFYDTFKCAVDSRSNLAPVQKLQYLKSCLKGEAAVIVKNLNLNDANYAIAIDLLKARYENVKNIREAHFDTIFNMQSIGKKNAVNLRKLCNVMDENIQALRNLGEPVQHWNSWLVYICKKRLDSETRFEWEKHTANNQSPTFKEMHDFLSDHAYALEASEEKSKKFNYGNKSASSTASVKCFSAVQKDLKDNCFLCGGDHRLSYCPEYTRLDALERKSKVLCLKLCLNCFSRKHFVAQCPKPPSCRACRKKHHPTLHFDDQHKESVEVSSSSRSVDDSTSNVSTFVEQSFILKEDVLLATALVYADSNDGQKILCRVLIDPGSQSSFVTRAFVQRLRLRPSLLKNGVNINGIGGIVKGTLNHAVDLNLSSVHSEQFVMVNALMIDQITSNVPRRSLVDTNLSGLSGLQLADEHFATPGPVDILLGADVYPLLIVDDMGVRKSLDGRLLAQQSIFGWIITGTTIVKAKLSDDDKVSDENSLSHFVESDDLLRKFWEIEDTPFVKPWSIEEKLAESHFKETTSRNENGRYIVALPFKDNFVLGESRSRALQRLHQMERRLSRDSNLKEDYSAVMREYLELSHAEKVPKKELKSNNAYYMPHHGVVKESSSTTKLRVVFDASAKTSTGHSLNDCLMVGPKVQQDLVNILMRFRLHPVCFSADIAKMYRQVILRPNDRDFHRFLWRYDPTQEVQEYRMTTVTFGVASSAYHAQRCLIKLADDEAEGYPLASSVVKRDVYMDDCLSGAADLSSAMKTQQELVDMLKSGGFNLRKWSSNSVELLKALPQELCEMNIDFDLDIAQSNHVIKTLGMYLSPIEDDFLFKVQPIESLSDVHSFTKRLFLSDSSRIFDPLGLLAPVLITTKIMFQSLWLTGISWDDQLPEDLLKAWMTWRTELAQLQKLRFPRCIVPKAEKVVKYELHGFCDASESAYAACVYLRTETLNNNVTTSLVAAKTKVAPLKRLSLPRLELCGALLLSRLMKGVQAAFSCLTLILFCWTDSLVTLNWISGEPSKWKAFVGNRVSEIQDLVGPPNWRYCPSQDNPADCASRGISPAQLLSHLLWFNGPPWLINGSELWPDQPRVLQTEDVSNEQRSNREVIAANAVLTQSVDVFGLFSYSSFSKLVRVVAWCRRWIPRYKRSGPLATTELKSSLLLLIKSAQADGFSKEISHLIKKKVIGNINSNLIALNPFLDDDGVLRVGGRLDLAQISYDRKHPILLPKHHRLTELIIQYEHLKNLHAGPQLLMATIRQTYWIIGARDLIRRFVHKCIICRRQRAETMQQIMGSLPSNRITSGARAFVNTGVDFAGPVLLKTGRGRGSRTEKAWIALFVCLAVKAIHLELVTSLSTEAFIATLKRFIARRGKPKAMYSDNGTNFVGARKELRHLMASEEHNDKVTTYLQQDNVEWHFIPQRGSHFGGLWEAGIKSMKYHLRRVLGNVSLTYEEMYTTLCQIEACLNSRPLTPLSSSPTDFQPLTPGHFLVTTPLNQLPEEDLSEVKVNRLNRWQHLKQLHQHFWKRWAKEYLNQLQQRVKWRKEKRNIQKDDLVILKEENVPPAKWVLGRVEDLHFGQDGKCRVVTVKTQNGTYVRPISKLVLILEEDE